MMHVRRILNLVSNISYTINITDLYIEKTVSTSTQYFCIITFASITGQFIYPIFMYGFALFYLINKNTEFDRRCKH
jgi:hypothetical protein